LTYPANGATNADMTRPVEWTTVPDAQTYYLYIGTSLGEKDLVDTGGLLATSFLVSGLPSGPMLYARIWAEVDGIWYSTDSTFTAAPSAPAPPLTATLIYPADKAANIDQAQPATWNAIPKADAYYLDIGTTLGAKDVIDSQGLHTTSFPIAFIPSGRPLYARLWTSVDGRWRYTDSTFTAAPIQPTFVFPTDGAIGIDGSHPFQWTSPAHASAQQLLVGTVPGGSDIFDSGQMMSTSVVVPGLAATGTLYARVRSLTSSGWISSDVAFTLAPNVAAASMLAPADGETAFDSATPFTWSAVPLARAYRLRIGTTPGASDVHDSGEIGITRRFVSRLPLGLLYGRLDTKLAGQWHGVDFHFTVSANNTLRTLQIQSAMWATDIVRNMADDANWPFSWSPLAGAVYTRRAFQAVCTDYTSILLRELADMNLPLQARRVDVLFNSNNRDAHALVEMLDPAASRWMLLDPTFDLTVLRASDRSWATADDLSASTVSQRWGDVSYQFLGALGDLYVRNYYLDYPLLFLDVLHDGAAIVPGKGVTVLPFMERLSLPASGDFAPYAARCAGDSTASLNIDGVDQSLDCRNVDGFSFVFGASTVAVGVQTAPLINLYRPRRFVF